MSEVKALYEVQPAPVAGVENVYYMLMAWLGKEGRALLGDDITARAEVGLATYGTALETHNGRDAERDWLEENEDACMYAMQALMEHQYDVERIELLTAQIDLTKKIKRLVNRRGK